MGVLNLSMISSVKRIAPLCSAFLALSFLGFVMTEFSNGLEGGATPAQDGTVSQGEYAFFGEFGDGLMEVFWEVEGDNIRMALRAKTTGWVSLGIGHSNAMADSDMIIGWVTLNGTVHVVDAYSTGPTGPHPSDTALGGTDDILSFGGREASGITTLEFVRKLDTGDRRDNPIPEEGMVNVLWAVGGSDSFDDMHTKRGYGTMDISSGGTTSEEPLTLWPIHAIFMTIGAGGMVAATVVLYRRKWKQFFRFHMWAMTVSVISAIIGLVTGYFMVEGGTGDHMRVPHSWFGSFTLVVALLSLGTGMYFRYSKDPKYKRSVRSMHRYFGWAGVALFFLTAASGFLQAMVVSKYDIEPWFLAAMLILVTVVLGSVMFLLTRGRTAARKE